MNSCPEARIKAGKRQPELPPDRGKWKRQAKDSWEVSQEVENSVPGAPEFLIESQNNEGLCLYPEDIQQGVSTCQH
jgi:hypothetical protein